MSELEKLVKLIPSTKSFIENISVAIVESDGVKKPVKDYVSDQMHEIDENCKLPNSEKFKAYIGKFLYVQIRSGTADRAINYLSKNFNTPNELANANAQSLVDEFRKIGYRFPNRAYVLIEISKILQEKFNGIIDDYVAYVDNNYSNDPILNVKGVGFKTRDIALSSFTKKYSLVDVHIIDVLSRTGLVLNAYNYGLKLTTDRSDDKNYLEITKLLNKLSKEAEMMPFEFDQTLWFFGKDYCSPMKCSECLVRNCITRNNRAI